MPLINPLSRVHCPFCFEKFHLAKAPLRLTKGEMETCAKIGNFLKIPPPRMKEVVPTQRGWAKNFTSRFLTDRVDVSNGCKVCPHCHLNLPSKLANGELSMETIAIVGARSSGKSNYIAMLIKNLKKRYATEVGFRVESEATYDVERAAMVDSMQAHKQRYGALFKSDPEAIDQTPSPETGAGTEWVRIPLILRLTFGTGRKKKIILISFFDAPGEELNDREKQFLYRYLTTAAGIIYLLDPFEIDGFVKSLPEVDRPTHLANEDPTSVKAFIKSLYEDMAGMKAKDAIKTHIAFSIAKADEFRKIARTTNETMTFLEPIRHRNGFNDHDSENASRDLLAQIRELDEGLAWELDDGDQYASRRFFATSALGQRPLNTENGLRLEREPEPLNVGDPVLWILFKLGLINESPQSCHMRGDQ